MRLRAVTWRGLEEWLAEHAVVELTAEGMRATGVQLGAEPEPYRADYRLDAPAGWITRRLEVEVAGEGRPSLVLEHDGNGAWTRRRAAARRRAGDVALDGDFTAELELGGDGPVVRYPRLAERV